MSWLKALFFWLSDLPDQSASSMTVTTWDAFVDSIIAQATIFIAIFVVIAVVGYTIQARRRRIIYPDQYFKSFTPLRWPLWISLTPAALVLWRFVEDYHSAFPSTTVSPIALALKTSLMTFFLTWLVSRLLVMFPGITPKKFRYRPLWFIPKARLSRSAEAQ